MLKPDSKCEVLQAQTGQGTSAPHTGLVESLVERVQEFVHPHHFAETPAETTATGQAPAAHSVADRAAGRVSAICCMLPLLCKCSACCLDFLSGACCIVKQ